MYTIQELCSRGRKVDTSRLTLEPEKILWKQGDVKNEEQLLKQRSRQISLSAREPVGRQPVFCWTLAVKYTAASAS